MPEYILTMERSASTWEKREWLNFTAENNGPCQFSQTMARILLLTLSTRLGQTLSHLLFRPKARLGQRLSHPERTITSRSVTGRLKKRKKKKAERKNPTPKWPGEGHLIIPYIRWSLCLSSCCHFQTFLSLLPRKWTWCNFIHVYQSTRHKLQFYIK